MVTIVEVWGDSREEVEDAARALLTSLFDQGAIENFDFTPEHMRIVGVEIE